MREKRESKKRKSESERKRTKARERKRETKKGRGKGEREREPIQRTHASFSFDGVEAVEQSSKFTSLVHLKLRFGNV